MDYYLHIWATLYILSLQQQYVSIARLVQYDASYTSEGTLNQSAPPDCSSFHLVCVIVLPRCLWGPDGDDVGLQIRSSSQPSARFESPF